MRYDIDNVTSVYEMAKEARVFGAPKPTQAYEASGLSYKKRRKQHKKYLQTKSQEKATRLSKAMLTGAGIGGVTGGLAGLAGGPNAALTLGVLGAGTGAGIGGLAHLSDKDSIRHARQTLKGGKKSISSDFDAHVVRAHHARKRREAQRHAQLLSAIHESSKKKSEPKSSPARTVKVYRRSARPTPPRPSSKPFPRYGPYRDPRADKKPALKVPPKEKKKDDMPSWATDRKMWEKSKAEVDSHLSKGKQYGV